VQTGKGLIDPCPLWDDDGQSLPRSRLRWFTRRHQAPAARLPDGPDGSKLLGEGEIVFSPTGKNILRSKARSF